LLVDEPPVGGAGHAGVLALLSLPGGLERVLGALALLARDAQDARAGLDREGAVVPLAVDDLDRLHRALRALEHAVALRVRIGVARVDVEVPIAVLTERDRRPLGLAPLELGGREHGAGGAAVEPPELDVLAPALELGLALLALHLAGGVRRDARVL